VTRRRLGPKKGKEKKKEGKESLTLFKNKVHKRRSKKREEKKKRQLELV
jgi:hypothetical protein